MTYHLHKPHQSTSFSTAKHMSFKFKYTNNDIQLQKLNKITATSKETARGKKQRKNRNKQLLGFKSNWCSRTHAVALLQGHPTFF